MADSTPGTAKAVVATGATFIAVELTNIIDPIITHSWPWLATPGVLSSIEALVLAAIVGATTWAAPHQFGISS